MQITSAVVRKSDRIIIRRTVPGATWTLVRPHNGWQPAVKEGPSSSKRTATGRFVGSADERETVELSLSIHQNLNRPSIWYLKSGFPTTKYGHTTNQTTLGPS